MSDTTEAPSCSTLRRHWEAMHSAESKSTQTATVADNSESTPAASGGFFGWLKSLFS